MDYQLSISLQDPEKITQLRRRLSSLIAFLREIGIYCWYDEDILKDRHLFLWQTVNQGKKTHNEIRSELSQLIAEFICDIEEPEMIRELIHQNFQFHSPEMKKIEQYVSRMISKKQQNPKQNQVYYKEQLAKQITCFLKERNRLAIDGFTRFRLGWRRKELLTCIKEAIEEYLLDREYKEFIQLLKYFVSVQTSKIDFVHVIHKGKKSFQLLKEDGSPLKLREVDGVLQEVVEQTSSYEDFIVSTLLTIAPERMILHTKHPKENVIRTLLQIFEGRIVICRGCSECGISFNFPGDA
ncbi:putative sporulation protein YtxC [Thermoflavimicrobium dichotomicum]|uniref:Putative sporulation protein YtxC n=1 Tax=Thermoflavimicrobium dichotomicum TaxID=46223 RepID=A0A1I3L959_9BACL|nr:putative sporulation protein YtxC [Thermoflavimicrobium dichotomicum]SFI81221.1 putative sporulation protein YtxC [Thermoflavimicrobium dichotomicum]